MKLQDIRDILENGQIAIYFATVAVAAVFASLLPGTAALESAINPALALMLFVTFLQVPMVELNEPSGRFAFSLRCLWPTSR